MKKSDLIVLIVVLVIVLIFATIPQAGHIYQQLNAGHGMWMSFIKFAVLATFGESLALRLRTGHYNKPGFGLLPKAVVWGIIGLTIKMAFVIFPTGTPAFLEYLGLEGASASLQKPLSPLAFITAFFISTAMNIIYAPVMMTFHSITDTHIAQQGGSLKALITPIPFRTIIPALDWDNLWNFVFKKTIPLFWIPAHTITFLLPAQHQVLFAAMLSIALGVILSLAQARK
ncbi:MAG TPA: Mpv17/PMP22 family protein [Bacteroidales bacterium]|nr:Mpv17/PMP22 family protein [Bacteroidales bacterium]